MLQVSVLADWVLNKAFSLSILGRYGIKDEAAHLQRFVHPCSGVENLMNGCWKYIFTSFRVETVDSEILCGIESSWLMCLAAMFKVQLLLKFGVRGECECSLQAKLASMIVCLLLCLFLQAVHCQLSVITFFPLNCLID